jgi:hypothetical protein
VPDPDGDLDDEQKPVDGGEKRGAVTFGSPEASSMAMVMGLCLA